MKKILLQFFFICIFAHSHFCASAQDSSHIRISLLTCTPGEELYSTFGHSALRIKDSSNLSDIVYNYGTFNFDDKDFYLKFVRGKLLYYVSTEYFEDFKDAYQSTNRGITEQVLNFSPEEKLNIQKALFENIKEENKYYKYDFFLDNCTTRLRDIIVKNKSDRPSFKAVMPKNTRFRQAIHSYLDKGEKYWSKLGIDILLGQPTDAIMSIEQSQFLPDNLMKSLDSSNQNHQVVLSETNLYPIEENEKGSFLFTPLSIFSALLITVFLISLSANKWATIFLKGFDGILFFTTGVLGIVLIFMWTGTDHAMCKNNFNLLWAIPMHAAMAFFIGSKKQWVKKYFALNGIFLALVLLSWFFLPQQMNNALLPLVLLLIYRSHTIYAH
ncbi:DUF4105 domain-containing protein [Ferruginibacter lapsinanis]|uniref:Lnb N-terminal periplasmic domain-containing protein n=1 Tax=Ferruginibacter lapsinanis TaxID=563172 RepID=UPI001E5FE6B1|nr:DUF4105 domain-containing protein [Ferruginibacter lapsinanis]UEG48496.1 DUF4105 domain-containing protein [Ferruginibacter lapsinanis]